MNIKENIKQKTAVVTGATSGIGFEAAKGLAAKGYYVIGVGRDDKKCEKAKKEIENYIENAKIDYLTSDLSSVSKVKKLGSDIIKKVSSHGINAIDVLINNAGAVSSWFIGTEDGFELQFAVNHLAPFLITHELFPLLKNSDKGRIITVSSGSHYRTRIRWNDILMRKRYNCLLAYKQSKLANVLFTAELERRLKQYNNIRAFAADPGLVNTNIGLKGTSGIVKWFWIKRSKRGDTPEVAARSIIYIAIEPSIMESKEIYWKECRAKKPSSYSQNIDNAQRLWEISERMCGIKSENYGLKYVQN